MAKVSARPDLGRHSARETSMALVWRKHAMIDYSWQGSCFRSFPPTD
jgi:hypothetical protein